MGRPRKGPRLYLRRRDRSGRKPSWVILDRDREFATGCAEDEHDKAKRALAAYRRHRPGSRQKPLRFRTPGEERAGLIYFIEGAGLVKIGFSENVTFRLGQLRSASPVPLTLLATIPGTENLERWFHRAIDDLHSHNEWFRLTPELRLHIENSPDLQRLLSERRAAAAEAP